MHSTTSTTGETETMTPTTAQVLTRAAEANPSLRRRLEAAGVDPAGVTSIADLFAVPVQGKDEMVADRDHVLGGRTPARIFQSPGPIYEVQPEGPDPWRWGEALESAGMRAGDVVINCFGYHLSPAGAMFDEAITAEGGTVVPAGIGNQQLQVDAIRDLGVRGYVGLPSYLKALTDVHAAGGGTPEDFPLEFALVTAEPLPDSLRAELQEWVPAVRMAYGSAEAGLIAYEDGAGPGMVAGTGITVDVCDLATGRPVGADADAGTQAGTEDAGTEAGAGAGSEGEVVVTLLRETAPLVRFGTGDLSSWVTDAGGAAVVGADGRRRLTGVLGRVGQAVKVKGMFLHPAQIRSVLARIDGVEAMRFVIGRENHVDTVACEVVLAGTDGAATGASGAGAGGAGAAGEAGAGAAGAEAVLAEAAELVRSQLRFRAQVRAVEAFDGDELIVDLRDWD